MSGEQLPIELRLGLRAGSVFYFQSRELTSAQPHFFVVVNRDPIGTKLLLLTIVTSQIEKVRLRNRTQPETVVEISPADPSRSDWGFSIYGGSVANLVLHDITLDGNTFEDGPSVDKEYFVPAAGAGVSAGNRHFQVSFSYIFWGQEFEGQDEHSKFGSLSLGYFF